MKQKDFLVWMLGFPITNSISEFVTQYLIGKTFSDNTHALNSLICLAAYCCIGYLLWSKKK